MTTRFLFNVGAGAVLLVLALGAGWTLAEHRERLLVRMVAAWVNRVVLPIVHCRSGLVRSAAIFLNNASVLAAVVGLGRWQAGGLVAVTTTGLALGMGFRVLAGRVSEAVVPEARMTAANRRRYLLGMGLNLLEVPAILLAAGLSVGREAMGLEPVVVWGTFARWAIPALALAAVGEALWIGAAGLPGNTAPSSAGPPSNLDSHGRPPPLDDRKS